MCTWFGTMLFVVVCGLQVRARSFFQTYIYFIRTHLLSAESEGGEEQQIRQVLCVHADWRPFQYFSLLIAARHALE